MYELKQSFDDNWSPRYFHFFGIFLASALIVTNVFSFKFINVLGFKFGGGAVLFPLCLILGDIITEVYGYRRARQVIITSLLCFLFYAVVSQIMIALPPAADWKFQSEFQKIFALAPRIFIAGALAYLAGELSNSFIMSKMKIAQGGNYFFVRAIVSTAVGQLLNSAVFFTTAFAGSYPSNLIVTLIINGTILKIIIEAIILPFTIIVVRYVKRYEGVEHYDGIIDLKK